MALSIQQALQQAVEAHKAGTLQDAEALYRAILQAQPKHPDANHNLGVIAVSLNKTEAALPLFKIALEANPNQGQFWLSYIDALIKEKQFDNARNVLEQGKKRGLVGEKVDVLEAQLTIIILTPNSEFLSKNNLLTTSQRLNKVTIKKEKRKKKKVSTNLTKPNQIKSPTQIEINNLLECYQKGQYDLAQNSATTLTQEYPYHPFGWKALGAILQQTGNLQGSLIANQKVLDISPNDAEAHCNLGITLKELGRLEDAFNSIIKSIRIKPTVVAKNLFIAISKKLNIETWDLALSQLVITALIEPWGRPSDVMPFAMRLLRKDKEFAKILEQSNHDINEAKLDESRLSLITDKEFVASTLVHAMLTSTPIPDSQLEKVFTTLRTHLLKVTSSLMFKGGASDDVASLYCWIAQQCFINEYVYFQTTDEIDSAKNLRNLLKKALEEDQSIPSALVIAVACYFPLYSIAGTEKLLRKNYSSDIYSVLVQQIQEPLEELDLRQAILSLTSIENQVSLKVQSQYEENPYPRWTRLPKDSSKKYLNSYIQNKFAYVGFQRLGEDRNPEILIAGCGTGQHSVGTSQVIKGAKILAVDLSMASLSYAKRKTAELDIDSIEYAQADLLKLNSLNRAFDVIESSGVLHHLENPFDGWKVLLSLLRPYGLMKLGFYSELARRDIVKVRNLISSAGIGSSPQDIRGYRKHLLGLKNSENYGFATNSSDFFSTSACRDLLFHVQEYRMNLRTVDRFIKDNDLTFLGFEIDSSVIQSYKKRFLNDMSATNLEQWHIYEEENPDTFIRMYQFYVQRKN